MNNLFVVIRDTVVRIVPLSARMFNLKPKHIVWLVHPRSLFDLEKKIPILKRLPRFLEKFIILLIPPYIVSEFSNGQNGESGYIVVIPLLPIMFQKHKFLSVFKAKQGLKLAYRLGAQKISVGGFLPTVVERVKIQRRMKLPIFDGTDLLAKVVNDKVKNIIKGLNSTASNQVIGIIGATTKSGSKISRLLTQNNNIKLNLFAKTKENVDKLRMECASINNSIQISANINFDSLSECDVVILTAFITDDGERIVSNLKQGSVFLSAIEPVSPFVDIIAKNRKDINLIKGISIEAPSISYKDFDFAVPTGSAYVCLTEAIINNGDHGLSNSNDTESLLKKNNFKIA